MCASKDKKDQKMLQKNNDYTKDGQENNTHKYGCKQNTIMK